ncbi:hypothetical protein ACFZB9_22725 [Kitasatospora sp. NPDC008050]|uniref:hypothetical protein n=1 Tax=Kitasatospora sp. NPDC008050 TaxID=3364021 RepID=UPI0036E5E9FB
MTEAQAEHLLSVAGESPIGLLGSTVDPSYFLSLHIDRHSAETLKAALLLLLESGSAGIEAKGIGRGLLEAVDDWIEAGGQYLGE